MNTPMELVFALPIGLMIGIAAGLFHFGGLWWTVKRAGNDQLSAAVFLISFVVRMAVTVGAFAFVLNLGNFAMLAASAGGFLIVRMVLMRSLGETETREIAAATSQEKQHA